MQQSLLGERLPILSGAASASSSDSAEAILVSVHPPDDGRQGSVLRLDSGSNVPLLYVDHQARTSARVQGTTIGKEAQFVYAFTPERNVRFGTQKEIADCLFNACRQWPSVFEDRRRRRTANFALQAGLLQRCRPLRHVRPALKFTQQFLSCGRIVASSEVIRDPITSAPRTA